MRRRAVLGAASAALTGLAGCIGGETEYRVAGVDGASPADHPLALDVTVADDSVTVDGPARFAFTLRNESDAAVRVRTTGVWPLGVLGLAPPSERGRSAVRLLSDRYAETDRVEVRSNGMSIDNDPLVRPLGAGESASADYELHGDDLASAGTYRLRGKFERVPLQYRRSGGDADSGTWTDFHPEVTVTLEAQSVLP